MSKIMFFCIPAHGHHNPTFPVVRALVQRENQVRYYSFETFREQIEDTGAEFFPCDSFLPELSEKEENAIMKVSTTQMAITDLRTTANMDAFLKGQVKEFCPDVIVSDSVCFWGKLTARKYGIPLVVSTTTFAFNRYSSNYMKSSFAEIVDMVLGSGRVKRELKALEAYGYHEKSILPLVQNDNETDTIVYATRRFQPCADTFSEHYAFVGPSVFAEEEPSKKHERPLVYISLGTVLNNKEDFYKKCIEALQNEEMDVIISCGTKVDAEALNQLADNVTVVPRVKQLEVLAKANVFLTHCGMNSVSESLYMGTPMVLYPQTNEQRAVARRAKEMNAATELADASAAGIRKAILEVLQNPSYTEHAYECREDFIHAPGPEGAAEFIEKAHHIVQPDGAMDGKDARG